MSLIRIIAPLVVGYGVVACGTSDGSVNTGGAGGAAGSGGSAPGGSGPSVPGGSFNAGTAPDRNRVQPGQVCDRLATVQCAGEQYCCANPGRTFDACKQASMTQCASVYLDPISQNPIAGYSVDAAETAFTQFESLASQCDPSIASWSISSAGLRGITAGTVAASAPCTPANVTDRAAVAGHLASCLNAGTHACLPTGVTGVPPLDPWLCSPRSQLNGPCFSDFNCADGLYCNNNLSSPVFIGSLCLQRKANGAGCAAGNECQSLTCAGGSCVQATQQTAYCLAQ